MRNGKILITGIVCLLVASFAAQTLSQTRRVAKPTARDFKHRMQEQKRSLDLKKSESGEYRDIRRRQESDKNEEDRLLNLRRTNPEKYRKEAQERTNKIREELLHEKAALQPTLAQWKVIKPLLEKIKQLRDQPISTARVSLTTNSNSRTGSRGRPIGVWQWIATWKDKPVSRWTEGQHAADELIALVGKRSTTDETFAKKMAFLRQCRRKEAAEKSDKNIDIAIAEYQQQLRQILTTRQEAALVLMRWL